VAKLESALVNYHEFTKSVLGCKVKCKKEAEDSFLPVTPGQLIFVFFPRIQHFPLIFRFSSFFLENITYHRFFYILFSD
jgi:hypothetical protein